MVQIVPSLFAARSLGLIARTTAAGDKKGPLIALITKRGNGPKRRRPMVQVQRKAGASIKNWRKHTRKGQAAAAGPGGNDGQGTRSPWRFAGRRRPAHVEASCRTRLGPFFRRRDFHLCIRNKSHEVLKTTTARRGDPLVRHLARGLDPLVDEDVVVAGLVLRQALGVDPRAVQALGAEMVLRPEA